MRKRTHCLPPGSGSRLSITVDARRTHNRTWPIWPKFLEMVLIKRLGRVRRRAQASPLPFACSERSALMRGRVTQGRLAESRTICMTFRSCLQACPDGDDSVARVAADGAGALWKPSTRASVLDQAREALASQSVAPERSMIERGLYWYDNQYVLGKISWRMEGLPYRRR